MLCAVDYHNVEAACLNPFQNMDPKMNEEMIKANIPVWKHHSLYYHYDALIIEITYIMNYITISNNVLTLYFHVPFIDGLVQDCSNSSALAMELLQSCTKPTICGFSNHDCSITNEMCYLWLSGYGYETYIENKNSK